jgi:hypothetical protein
MDDESAGTNEEMTLLIRPEELSIGFPSRMSVNQTLGGAWADSFGEGLEEGTYAGTLGWRATSNDSGGIERLANLKNFAYSDWHARRAAAVAKGDDPAMVKLILVDTLNNYSRVIAPRVFELKRSKSRPLLAQYRFNFVMLSRDVTGKDLLSDTAFGGFLGTIGSWIDSFTMSINNITNRVKEAYRWIDRTIIAPVKAFVAKTQKLLGAVRNFVTAGVGIIRQVGSVAQLATAAAMNIFRAAALVINIPNIAKAAIMNVVREFTNLFCLLRNAKSALGYEDYSDLYGASNCSSTSGGRSISVYSGSNTNTFSAVTQTPASPVVVTQNASIGLRNLASADLVTTTLTPTTIGANLSAVNSGMSVIA